VLGSLSEGRNLNKWNRLNGGRFKLIATERLYRRRRPGRGSEASSRGGQYIIYRIPTRFVGNEFVQYELFRILRIGPGRHKVVAAPSNPPIDVGEALAALW
jgi:hypothetical protein